MGGESLDRLLVLISTTNRARLWKKLAKKLYSERVDICPNCGRECDPTTCWCGDDHRKSYGDGGHSHIPMGCVCGYAVEVERDHFVLKQMLLLVRGQLHFAEDAIKQYRLELNQAWVERDKAINDLETLKINIGISDCAKVFCEDPACSKNNQRT